MDTFYRPIGVWIRGVPLYNAQDSSLILWTLSTVLLVSGLEEFHRIDNSRVSIIIQLTLHTENAQ